MQCLQGARDQLGVYCRAALSDFEQDMAEDIDFNAPLKVTYSFANSVSKLVMLLCCFVGLHYLVLVGGCGWDGLLTWTSARCVFVATRPRRAPRTQALHCALTMGALL